MRSDRHLPLLLSTTLLGFASAHAADGDPDPGFGIGGYAASGTTGYVVDAVAIRPDGRILTCGDDGLTGPGEGFVVMQFRADGTLDPTFGDQGVTHVVFDPADDTCTGIAVQPDGRIVVAGYVRSPAIPAGFLYAPAAARLTHDGAPDPDFGDGAGKRIYALRHIVNAMALQGDGKILLAGMSLAAHPYDFSVLRILADGTPDPEFGTDAQVTVSFVGTTSQDQAEAIAVDDQQRIVVAGTADAGGASAIGVVRLLPDGQPDSAFGNDGQVRAGNDALHYGAFGNALVLQRDGKIVVAGGRNSLASPFANSTAVRLQEDGSVDTTYGDQGATDIGFSPAGVPDTSFESAAIRQDDGKVVLAGVAFDADDHKYATVARLDTQGQVDASFADGGSTIIPLADAQHPSQWFSALALSDGRVVAAGFVDDESGTIGGFSGLLVRLQSDLIFFDSL